MQSVELHLRPVYFWLFFVRVQADVSLIEDEIMLPRITVDAVRTRMDTAQHTSARGTDNGSLTCCLDYYMFHHQLYTGLTGSRERPAITFLGYLFFFSGSLFLNHGSGMERYTKNFTPKYR